MSVWAMGAARLTGAHVGRAPHPGMHYVGQAPDPGPFPRVAEVAMGTWLYKNVPAGKLAALRDRRNEAIRKYGVNVPPSEVCAALAAILSRAELESLFEAVPDYGLLWAQYCADVGLPPREPSAVPPPDAGEYPRAAEWNAGEWMAGNLPATKLAAIKVRSEALFRQYGDALPPNEVCAMFAAILSRAELSALFDAIPEYREMWEVYCSDVAQPVEPGSVVYSPRPAPALGVRGAPTGASIVAVVLIIAFAFARARSRR